MKRNAVPAGARKNTFIMPTQSVLKSRLYQHKLDFIFQDSTLVSQMANKELTITEIIVKINFFIDSYCALYPDSASQDRLRAERYRLMHVFVADYPAASRSIRWLAQIAADHLNQ